MWAKMLYPDDVLVENTLRVWVISRWRGVTELTKVFLGCGYGHLPSSPPGAPLRFRVEEVRGPCGGNHRADPHEPVSTNHRAPRGLL
jgi:hypothetical protein